MYISVINIIINHVSADSLTTGRMIPSRTNSLPAEVSTSDSHKNVYIKCSPHDAFLKQAHQVRSKSKDCKAK